MKTLKATIQALHDRGFSQEAIAKEAGVSQMTISRWSKKNPRLVNMGALAKMQKFLERVRDEQM